MSASFSQLWERTLGTVVEHMARWLPPLLVALVVLAAAFILARLAHWVLLHTFQGKAFDRFLTQSGITHLLRRPGQWRSARLVAEGVYALVLVVGALVALSAFDSSATTRIVETVAMLLPKLAIAAVLLLAGAWLAQFLGRSTLVWAVNENLPRPRHWANGVRALIFGLTVVVAADTLNFAPIAFLGTYLLLVAGVVLSVSLAIGMAGRETLRRYFTKEEPHSEDHEHAASLWNHL